MKNQAFFQKLDKLFHDGFHKHKITSRRIADDDAVVIYTLRGFEEIISR